MGRSSRRHGKRVPHARNRTFFFGEGRGMKHRMRNVIKIFSPLLLLVFSLLLSLLGVEVAYRYHLYNQMKNHPTYWAANDSIYEYHRELGYTHIPAKRIVEMKVERGYPVLWNESFTDQSGNMARVKVDNGRREYRILVLGDSFTAYQRDGSTWPDLLQEKLDARFPGKFDVVNCGRNMYGILQMFDLASVKVKELQPDLVVVAFITDDLKRCRFWMTVDSSQGGKRVIKKITPLDAADSAPSMDSFLVHTSITKPWCESMMKSKRPDHPLLEAMNDQYRSIMMEERYRDIFFTCSASFVFNRVIHGDAFHGLFLHLREPALEARVYRDDSRFRDQVAVLNANRVPYLLVHLPTYQDLQAGKYVLNSLEGELLQSLRELTGRDIISLMDYTARSGEQTERFYMLPHDGHPSRMGLELFADSVFNMLAWEGITKNSSVQISKGSWE